jgi:hypothetical protein
MLPNAAVLRARSSRNRAGSRRCQASGVRRLLTLASMLDVSVTKLIAASPARIRAIMFDARQDPTWMAAMKAVEPLTEELRPGARAMARRKVDLEMR